VRAGYAVVGLCGLLAAPCLAQSPDPFRSAPAPVPDKPAMPRTNAPRPRPPAVEREPAVATPPNLDRIREFAAARNMLLPQDLQIKRPGPDIPAAMARFSGVWGGDDKWNGRCHNVIIAVEIIQRSGQAVVVYSEGPAESSCYGNATSPWFRRFYAVIQGDSIVFTAGVIERTFTLINDNQLRGVSAANPDLKPPFKGAVISISRLN